jgi:hypothetical protein
VAGHADRTIRIHDGLINAGEHAAAAVAGSPAAVAGSPDPATGLDPRSPNVAETFGQTDGTVGRPCHSCGQSGGTVGRPTAVSDDYHGKALSI